MRTNFTPEQDEFILSNIDKCKTLYALVDMFNAKYPFHAIKYSNLGKHLALLGVKKGTHNVRKECVKSRNAVGCIIRSRNHGARIKTENGYVFAGKHYAMTHNITEGRIVHLNGDCADFSDSNIEIVETSVFSSMCWRGWLFKNPELTRTAILAARLLLMFPQMVHNEKQYLGAR